MYLLLLGFLFLYLGAVLVTCLVFFLHTRDLPITLDKAMAYPHSPEGPHWEQHGLRGGRA